jgi:hypothetical protein
VGISVRPSAQCGGEERARRRKGSVRGGGPVGDGGGDGDAPVGAAAAPERAAGGEILCGGARLQRQRLHAPMG